MRAAPYSYLEGFPGRLFQQTMTGNLPFSEPEREGDTATMPLPCGLRALLLPKLAPSRSLFHPPGHLSVQMPQDSPTSVSLLPWPLTRNGPAALSGGPPPPGSPPDPPNPRASSWHSLTTPSTAPGTQTQLRSHLSSPHGALSQAQHTADANRCHDQLQPKDVFKR